MMKSETALKTDMNGKFPGQNENLTYKAFIATMISLCGLSLVILGMIINFMTRDNQALRDDVNIIKSTHIEGGNRLTALETKSPEIERRLGNIESSQANIVNMLGEILRNIKQNLK